MTNTCQNCGQEIRISINRGTGYCSENCRKALAERETNGEEG